MKKHYVLVLVVSVILFQACTNGKTTDVSNKEEIDVNKTSVVDTLSDVNRQRKEITEEQFLAKVETYLKKNKTKYDCDYESTDVKSGDYDGDNFKDFIATAHFHEDGSDYFTSFYFYQSSTSDELISLIVPSVGSDKQFSIRKIEKNKIFVRFFVGDPIIGEKTFDSTIQIEKNKIKFAKYDVEKADQIMDELMMEHSNNQMEE